MPNVDFTLEDLRKFVQEDMRQVVREESDASFDRKFKPAFDEAFGNAFAPAFEAAFGGAFGGAFEGAFAGAFGPAFTEAFEPYADAIQEDFNRIHQKLAEHDNRFDRLERIVGQHSKEIIELRARIA